MTEQLLAWFGSQPLKEEVMERLRKHREADEFLQGTYQRLDPKTVSGYRGCAIGCTLPPRPTDGHAGDEDGAMVQWPDAGWHGEVERQYGIDYWIGAVIDEVFESLPPTGCGDFAVTVVEAIPVGADLSNVADWARVRSLKGWDRGEAPGVAAEFIERLRTAPAPTPA